MDTREALDQAVAEGDADALESIIRYDPDAYGYFVQRLSSSVRVSSKTGFILPQDRNRIQAGCQNQLNVQLVDVGAETVLGRLAEGS
jgi:hypothetical protein